MGSGCMKVSPRMGSGSGDTAEGPAGPSQQQRTGCLPSLGDPRNPKRWHHNFLSPQSPPNFLRASALAEHVKPVVVIPEEAPEDEEPENLIEISTSSTEPQVGAQGPGWGLGDGHLQPGSAQHPLSSPGHLGYI